MRRARGWTVTGPDCDVSSAESDANRDRRGVRHGRGATSTRATPRSTPRLEMRAAGQASHGSTSRRSAPSPARRRVCGVCPMPGVTTTRAWSMTEGYRGDGSKAPHPPGRRGPRPSTVRVSQTWPLGPVLPLLGAPYCAASVAHHQSLYRFSPDAPRPASPAAPVRDPASLRPRGSSELGAPPHQAGELACRSITAWSV